MMKNPLFSKILMILLLTLLLLIPLGMIQSKISERQMLQEQVQRDIARSASGAQTLTGPYLVLRYKQLERTTVTDNSGKERVTTQYAEHDSVVMPRNLQIDGEADVETRKRGIYGARLFNLHSTIKGEFVVPRGYGVENSQGDIIPLAAYFVLNVSDSRGIRNAPVLTLNDKQHEFEPGRVGPISGNGIHVPLPALSLESSHTFTFDLPLELQGMSTLAVTPVGDNTAMSLKSSWPHPSFGGSFLPRERKVDEQGFNAQWLVTNLARNGQGEAGGSEIFSVDFIDPVNVYLLSERAVKYGVLFVVLVFAAFFLFEMLRRLRIHPMQYLLVGTAMAMFFLLIISLSEHIAFATAYVISGSACAALIGIYLAGVLKSRKPALAFSGGIALLYAVLYGVLQSEDNALLMGTLVMFTALAAMMVLTRRMDWYGVDAVNAD